MSNPQEEMDPEVYAAYVAQYYQQAYAAQYGQPYYPPGETPPADSTDPSVSGSVPSAVPPTTTYDPSAQQYPSQTYPAPAYPHTQHDPYQTSAAGGTYEGERNPHAAGTATTPAGTYDSSYPATSYPGQWSGAETAYTGTGTAAGAYDPQTHAHAQYPGTGTGTAAGAYDPHAQAHAPTQYPTGGYGTQYPGVGVGAGTGTGTGTGGYDPSQHHYAETGYDPSQYPPTATNPPVSDPVHPPVPVTQHHYAETGTGAGAGGYDTSQAHTQYPPTHPPISDPEPLLPVTQPPVVESPPPDVTQPEDPPESVPVETNVPVVDVRPPELPVPVEPPVEPAGTVEPVEPAPKPKPKPKPEVAPIVTKPPPAVAIPDPKPKPDPVVVPAVDPVPVVPVVPSNPPSPPPPPPEPESPPSPPTPPPEPWVPTVHLIPRVKVFSEQFVAKETPATDEMKAPIRSLFEGMLGTLGGKLQDSLSNEALIQFEQELRQREADCEVGEVEVKKMSRDAKKYERDIERRLRLCAKKEEEFLTGIIEKSDQEIEEGFVLLNQATSNVEDARFSTASQRANATLNRYRKVYNHTLLSLPSGKYINASMVDIFKTKYIATQWPLSVNDRLNSENEFWEMIDTYKVEVIIVLQPLAPPQCQRYWPIRSGERKRHEPKYSVTCVRQVPDLDGFRGFVLSLAVYPDQPEEARGGRRKRPTRRKRTLKKGASLNQFAPVSRSITLFYVDCWPERDVPEDSDIIRDVREAVLECNPNPEVPIVVHGTAGIGRTGTYIAIDMILKNEWRMDKIPGVVQELRKQRYGAIETWQQYGCVHDVIMDELQGDSSESEGDSSSDS